MYDAIDDPYTYESSIVLNIESQATKLFAKLEADSFLQNLGGSTFADKAAHFLAELNAIHAFREGNGRSQLTFFALLADYAATRLIWTNSTRIKCWMP